VNAQHKKTSFDTYIRSLRLLRGFGIRELARQLAISGPHLSALKKDKLGTPHVDLVRTIEKTINADVL